MFDRIVAGVSRTDTAKSVGDQAVELANLLGSELHLVACYDPADLSDRPVDQHSESLLDAVAQRAVGKVETHVRSGEPAEAILDVARRNDADLIIVGNKGLHGARRVLGSVPKSVTLQASCAVMILATT